MRPPFFGGGSPDDIGVAVFLNAGDPPLPVLRDVVAMLDDCSVGCLELAIPFPDLATEGPVIRRSARRALDLGVGTAEVLGFLHDVHARLDHLRTVLVADWSLSLKTTPLLDFLGAARDSGADACLILGVPPKVRPSYYEAARQAGMPVVTTCYATSSGGAMAEAASNASAYLYLVARYGRTGAGPAAGYEALSGTIGALRTMTEVPIAVGFGVGSRSDLEALRRAGADAAVVGSAAVECVERALVERRDVVEELQSFIRRIHPCASTASTSATPHVHRSSQAEGISSHDCSPNS